MQFGLELMPIIIRIREREKCSVLFVETMHRAIMRRDDVIKR